MAWEQHSHADGETFTADDMNRMEEAIYDGGGYSYKKEWADQNVPGVEGWNRLENGISDIGTDLLGKNLIPDSRRLSGKSGSSDWEVREDTDFNYLYINTDSTSWVECAVPVDIPYGTKGTVTVSFEYQESTNGLLRASMGAFSGSTRAAELSVTRANTFNVIGMDGDWIVVSDTFLLDDISEENADNYRYQFKKASGSTGEVMVRMPKVEYGSNATNWSPDVDEIFTPKTWESEQDENNIINADNANRWEQGITDMLAYREEYGENTNVTPASEEDVKKAMGVEDSSDEVAAPEAEEIE